MKKMSPKTQKYLIIILVVILLIAIYFKVFKPFNDPDTELDLPSGSGSGAPNASNLKKVGNNATLKRGLKAQEVRWLQYYYNKRIATPTGVTKLTEDGIFGAKTEAVVKTVTGKTSTTWTEFKSKIDTANSIPTPGDSTGYQFSEEELPWLTQ